MSTGAGAPAGIAGVEVVVDGAPLDPTLAGALQDVVVDESLALPATFAIRLTDPDLQHVDTHPLMVGAEVEIKMGGPGARGLTTLVKGRVAAVEPEFRASGVVIAARGYDRSHALNRSPHTETYQNTTVGDVVTKVAGRWGLSADVEDAGGVHDFIQQSDETDWDFLWRLARRVGNEVRVEDTTLRFRRAGGDGAEVELRYGAGLSSFMPRLTGVQQVEEVVVRGWDHTTKRAIEATARTDAPDSTIGVPRGDVVSALDGGTLRVADAPVATQDEADALARSIAGRVTNAYLEAEGACEGDARIRAGSRVKVAGVGQRFSGTYAVTSARHTIRGRSGYTTAFRVSGRASRELVELATPARDRRWNGGPVAVGVVTQNEDPEGLGRVRVTYPPLGDDTEGWWARVAAPGAGAGRGVSMMPVVGDEVLVTFEHGDVRRPYVVGGLWNGDSAPGEGLTKADGSFTLASDERIEMTSTGDILVTGDAAMTVEVQGDATRKSSGATTIESGGTMTIKGSGSVTVEAGGSLTIKASGSLSIESSGSVRVSGSAIQLG